MWDVIICPCPWYLLPEAGIKGRGKWLNPTYMWDVVTCPWYLVLAHKSTFHLAFKYSSASTLARWIALSKHRNLFEFSVIYRHWGCADCFIDSAWKSVTQIPEMPKTWWRRWASQGISSQGKDRFLLNISSSVLQGLIWLCDKEG